MKKKIKIAILCAAGVFLLGGLIWVGTKKLSGKTVDVYSVAEIMQPWGEQTSLDGNISSHVSQEVKLQEKQIVSQVHVKEGQEVKKGDPLLSYDMTLVNIDMEMEKLNKQKLELKQKDLEREIEKLKKTKTVSANPKDYQIENLGTSGKTWNISLTAQEELPEGIGKEEEVTPNEENPGNTDDKGNINGPVEPGEPGETEPPEEPVEPGEPEDIPKPSGVYKRLYEDVSIDDTEFENDDAIIEKAIPFAGKGTKEEPFRFLCTRGVLIQGAFLNKIAGFDSQGVRVSEPVFCRLEVRGDDSQEGILYAAMLLDGNELEEMLEPSTWYITRLGKNEWEAPGPDEEEGIPGEGIWEELPEDIGGFVPDEEIIGGYSKEELAKAVKDKEKELADIKLDLKEVEIKIKKVEQKLSDQTICSTLDGVVKKVGDPAKGEVDGEPFIVVESSKGAYVQGRAGEYVLDQIKPGQIVTGIAYESGLPFEAEITEVSPYPQEGYVESGRELSYYPFTAVIEVNEGFKENESVSMDLPQDMSNAAGIYIGREYVRTQNGEDFVYKEGKNHKLVKQPVKIGRTFYGSSVEIKEGITQEDYVAFPYGKQVKEGAKTRKASMEELYGMY